jgi:hypothetical protein
MPLPFTGKSNIVKFTPTKAKVSSLYKSVTKNSTMSASVKASAIKALQNAGYDSVKISKIMNKDEALPVAKLKQVARDLKAGKVYGFATKNPDIAVKQYLNKERLKSQSIARIRKEHMLEERADDVKNNPNNSRSSNSGHSNRVNLPF